MSAPGYSQQSIYNTWTLHPQDPQGQDDDQRFVFGPEDRTMPDNQAGFRTYSTTSWAGPAPSYLSTTSALRLQAIAPPPSEEYHTFYNDKWPYEQGFYNPPVLAPLNAWPVDSHGITIAGPFDPQDVHLVNPQGQVVDTWPFIPPGQTGPIPGGLYEDNRMHLGKHGTRVVDQELEQQKAARARALRGGGGGGGDGPGPDRGPGPDAGNGQPPAQNNPPAAGGRPEGGDRGGYGDELPGAENKEDDRDPNAHPDFEMEGGGSPVGAPLPEVDEERPPADEVDKQAALIALLQSPEMHVTALFDEEMLKYLFGDIARELGYRHPNRNYTEDMRKRGNMFRQFVENGTIPVSMRPMLLLHSRILATFFRSRNAKATEEQRAEARDRLRNFAASDGFLDTLGTLPSLTPRERAQMEYIQMAVAADVYNVILSNGQGVEKDPHFIEFFQTLIRRTRSEAYGDPEVQRRMHELRQRHGLRPELQAGVSDSQLILKLLEDWELKMLERERENTETQSTLDSASGFASVLDDLQSEYKPPDEAKEELENKEGPPPMPALEQLKQKLAELEEATSDNSVKGLKEQARLRAELDDLHEQMDHLIMKSITDLEVERTKRKIDSEKAAAEYKAAQAQQTALKRRIEQAEARIAKIEENKTAMETERDKLKDQLKDYMDISKEEREKRIEALTEAQAQEIMNQRLRLEEITTYLGEKYEAELKEQEGVIEASGESLETLTKQLADLTADVNNVNGRLANVTIEMGRATQFRNEINRRLTAVEAYNKSVTSAKLSRYDEEIAKIKAKQAEDVKRKALEDEERAIWNSLPDAIKKAQEEQKALDERIANLDSSTTDQFVNQNERLNAMTLNVSSMGLNLASVQQDVATLKAQKSAPPTQKPQSPKRKKPRIQKASPPPQAITPDLAGESSNSVITAIPSFNFSTVWNNSERRLLQGHLDTILAATTDVKQQEQTVDTIRMSEYALYNFINSVLRPANTYVFSVQFHAPLDDASLIGLALQLLTSQQWQADRVTLQPIGQPSQTISLDYASQLVSDYAYYLLISRSALTSVLRGNFTARRSIGRVAIDSSSAAYTNMFRLATAGPLPAVSTLFLQGVNEINQLQRA